MKVANGCNVGIRKGVRVGVDGGRRVFVGVRESVCNSRFTIVGERRVPVTVSVGEIVSVGKTVSVAVALPLAESSVFDGSLRRSLATGPRPQAIAKRTISASNRTCCLIANSLIKTHGNSFQTMPWYDVLANVLRRYAFGASVTGKTSRTERRCERSRPRSLRTDEARKATRTKICEGMANSLTMPNISGY